MSNKKHRNRNSVQCRRKYPPSEPCVCDICTSYCMRPGWWTVDEAQNAVEAGYAGRMMLEVSPERDFGVLSPSFKGNEGQFALQIFSQNGCTFLDQNHCELHGTMLLPLECAYCHHDRKGQGLNCHLDIEKDWNSDYGKKLVVQWGDLTGFWKRQGFVLFQ